MANYELRTETVERIIYSLSLPTNWVEVAKMTAAVAAELASRCLPQTDDAVTVEVDEDSLRYVIEVWRR